MKGEINTFVMLKNRSVIKYSKEAIVLMENVYHISDLLQILF